MTPYINLLNDNSSIGMIRLGHLPIDQSGKCIGLDHHRYIDIDPDPSFQYSGNPHLKHDRFMMYYGKMPTGLHPGNTEMEYDRIVRKRRDKGPRILWPLSIGDRYLWGHIGTVPAYSKD